MGAGYQLKFLYTNYMKSKYLAVAKKLKNPVTAPLVPAVLHVVVSKVQSMHIKEGGWKYSYR